MNDLERQLVEIAKKAGVGIMRFRGDPQPHQLKSDLSPVTQADLWASEFITGELKKTLGDVKIISEEGSGFDPTDSFWLVDPLDGTKEFINGFDDFTVNIAKVDNGQTVLGVVYLPATQTAYIGGKDLPALKIAGGQENPIWVRKAPSEVEIAVSRSHLDTKTQEFADQFPNHVQTAAGSSMKFCLIAEGQADVYPRFGRTMEWDTAAGQAVLEAAGGRVVSVEDLKPLGYAKSGLENPGFIAIGHEAVLEKTKGLQ